MKLISTISILITSFVLTSGHVQGQINVEQIEIGTGIENRTLIGADSTFSSDVNTLYCFTKINGAEKSPVLKHIWYYENEEKASIDLTIRTNSFRTWSSKKIWKSWIGEWRVEVIDENGEILASKKFVIEGAN